MSVQNLQRSAPKRQPLAHLSQNHSNNKQHHIQPQLNEKLRQLQARINEQDIQIQLLSQQLSSEIRLKEELRHQLHQEKQKHKRGSSPHRNLLQSSCLTRRKVSKGDITEADKTGEYQWTLAHLRDTIKSKQQVIDKSKLKLEEYKKKEQNYLQIEKEIRCLRDLFIKSQQKQVSLQQEIQSLKNKLQRLSQVITEKQEELTVSNKHFQKLQTEHKSLLTEFYRQQQDIRLIQKDMKEIMSRQNDQIRSLQAQLSRNGEDTDEASDFKDTLTYIKREVKRLLLPQLKDPCLRKKMQGEIQAILQGKSGALSVAARPMSTIVEE